MKHSHEEKCVLDRRKVQCLKCKVKLYSSEKFAIYNKIKFRIKIVIYLASKLKGLEHFRNPQRSKVQILHNPFEVSKISTDKPELNYQQTENQSSTHRKI